VDFYADLFVLNPPWDLHWHREALQGLMESDVPAVREAFAARDERIGRNQIDSTVATLCLALDRCTPSGEGMLIANEATLQRLIFKPDAPHHALANHVWADLRTNAEILKAETLKTNTEMLKAEKLKFSESQDVSLSACQRVSVSACQRFSLSACQRVSVSAFQNVSVIYFAPAHGGQCVHHQARTLAEVEEICGTLARNRLRLRLGEEARPYTLRFTEETGDLWRAIGAEWNLRNPSSIAHPSYNLWLQPDGSIGVNVSLFDQRSGRVDSRAAARLFALKDKRPMQLVIMRNERRALEEAIGKSKTQNLKLQVPKGSARVPRAVVGVAPTWTVDPRLIAAVEQAVAEYERERAPLYPLPPVMRLGYLDEHDDILCEHDLFPHDEMAARRLHQHPGGMRSPAFIAGQRYALRSLTIQVNRQGTKINNSGSLDAVEWNGQELAFYIRDSAGVERVFMDGCLRDTAVTLNAPAEEDGAGEYIAIDYTLQELVECFKIPDAPDVAQLNPAEYRRNLQLLDEIERLVNAD
jgi:hypothetical protein